MKLLVASMGILALLLLNWAALHDILEGEADVRLEWFVVSLSLVVLAGWTISRLRKRAA